MLWDQDDQDKALGWMEYESSKCPGCGTIVDDWFNAEGVPHKHHPYELDSKRCVGCQILHEEQELAAKDGAKGIYFFFRRRVRGRSEQQDRNPG